MGLQSAWGGLGSESEMWKSRSECRQPVKRPDCVGGRVGLGHTFKRAPPSTATTDVIPPPCLHVRQPSGDGSTQAALIFLFRNTRRAGTLPLQLQGSANWLPSKITEEACVIMIANDKDDQVYLGSPWGTCSSFSLNLASAAGVLSTLHSKAGLILHSF